MLYGAASPRPVWFDDPSDRSTPPWKSRAAVAHKPKVLSIKLDRSDECVYRGGDKITLPPKAFALLRHLAERQGRLVTKEDLLDAVWPGVFVGDAVLKVAIREIRAALGDDARDPMLIQTVHRRGYRFVGQVEVFDGPDSGLAPSVLAKQPDGAAWRPSPSPSLVGRSGAMATLAEYLGLAAGGERQLVFVTGEPGIGKTALVESFLAHIGTANGVHVVRGQCLELAGPAEAYLPFLDGFGRLLREPGGADLLPLVRRFAPTWLRQMPSLLSAGDVDALDVEIRGATPERMLREMAEAIEAIARQQPLVIVLEDLQWSDPSTVDLLSALAHRRERAAVLIIGTYRPVDVVLVQHPLRAITQDLQARRLSAELPLELLNEEATACFIDVRFGRHRLPPEFAQIVFERTDGNPLFVISVLDYLVHQGVVRHDVDGAWMLAVALDEVAIGVPDSLRRMIEKQIERLSADDQRLLEAASVAGMEFPSIALSAAIGLEESEVEDRCLALEKRNQMLSFRGVGELPGRAVGRFGFTHSIYQQVLYQRIPPAKRARLHLRIGEQGEAAYGRRVPEIASELAVHFEQARDVRRAVIYLRLAAENAARRFANKEAIACLRRALDITSVSDGPDATGRQIALLMQLGVVLRSSGDVKVAAEQFLEAARLAGELGHHEDEARAWMYAASVLSWFNRERCLRAAERAERISESLTDDVLRAHVRGYAGYARLIWERWSEADAEACARAFAVTRDAGEIDLFAFHVGRYVHTLTMRSEYAAAARAAEEGLTLAQFEIDTYDYLMCQFWRAWALLHLGRLDETRQIIDDATRATALNGHRRLTILFALLRAWVHEQSGEFKLARDICRQSLGEAHQTGYGFGELIGQVLLGFSELGLGAHGAARRAFEEIAGRLDRERMLMDWIWRMPLTWGLARLSAETGDIDAALQHAQRLLTLASESGEKTWMALAHSMLARGAVAQRRWKAGEAAMASAVALVESNDLPLASAAVRDVAAITQSPRPRADRQRTAVR